eukprot:6175729-Pleurochrysis_carterae.AAC.3
MLVAVGRWARGRSGDRAHDVGACDSVRDREYFDPPIVPLSTHISLSLACSHRWNRILSPEERPLLAGTCIACHAPCRDGG